jgi:SAM-dependent methyltransferase
MKNIEQIVPKKRRFDGAICLGHVFYHLMTDKEVLKFLSGLRRKLKEGGLFVFNVRNAKRMNEKYLNVLRLDHMVDEKKLQVAVFSHNLRDSRDPNVLLWRPIYFVKENEKMDFQVREHRLRWFKFLPLKKLIEKSDYEISAVYSGPAKEKFRENEHDDMWFITVTK